MFRRISIFSAKWPGMLLLLAMMALPGLARDRDAFPGEGALPPEPNPLEVDVPRGGPVWITLSAYSLTAPIIRFRIKRLPKGGKLGTPQFVTASTARVKYQPPAGSGEGDDSFAYEVQSEAGVSAPAEVQISITDTDPQVITPLDLEFGEVLPGASARLPLVMQNIGGGVAEGMVRVPDGWSIDGDPNYRLTAGQKQTFTVIFSPMEQQAYTGDVEYTGNPERATDLNGVGVAPIAVMSGTLELTAAGTMRTGTIHLQNRTDSARTLKVTAGPGLEAKSTVDVPAKGAAEIEVQAKGDGEIQDRVTLEGEDIKTDVGVHAAAVQVAEQPVAANTQASPPATVEGPAPMAQVSNDATQPAAAGTPDDTAPPDTGLPPVAQEMEGLDRPLVGVPSQTLVIGRIGENEATAGFDFKDAPAAKSYRLEGQSVALDAQGGAMARWTPFTNTTVTVKGTIVIAHVQQLQAGAMYVVRLVGLDQQGNVIEMTAPREFWTVKAKEDWGWAWAGLAVAAVGAGAWAVWRKGRKRRR